jgi:hypothetical protein
MLFFFKILEIIFFFSHKFLYFFIYIFYKLDDYKLEIKRDIVILYLKYCMFKSILLQNIKNISTFSIFAIKPIPGQIIFYLYKLCIYFFVLMTVTYFFISLWFTWYICDKEIMFSYIYQRDISYDFWTWIFFEGDYQAEFDFYKILLSSFFNIYIYMFNIILLLLLFHILYSLKNIIRDYINGINIKLYNIYSNLVIFVLLYYVFNIFNIITSYLTLSIFFNIYIFNIYIIIILLSIYSIKVIMNILITKKYRINNLFHHLILTDDRRNVFYFYVSIILIIYYFYNSLNWLWDWSIQLYSLYYPTWTPFGKFGGLVEKPLTLNWFFYMLWDKPFELVLFLFRFWLNAAIFEGVVINYEFFVRRPLFNIVFQTISNIW